MQVELEAEVAESGGSFPAWLIGRGDSPGTLRRYSRALEKCEGRALEALTPSQVGVFGRACRAHQAAQEAAANDQDSESLREQLEGEGAEAADR